jgi:hypothetical protein
MERAQREVKQKLRALSADMLSFPGFASKAAVHELNHRTRRCLSGKTPCHAFEEREYLMKTFTSRKRKEVYTLIAKSAKRITGIIGGRCNENTSMRLAVQNWLVEKDHITITRGQEVLPSFRHEKCS